MGGRDDELGLSLSLGFGVTTQPSFQPTHMHRPLNNSMHNHLRKSSWNELFQFSGNLLISCVLSFSFGCHSIALLCLLRVFVLDL